MNINSVTIGGNLTRDPELKHTQGGKSVCNFGIAINRSWHDASGQKQERTTYVDCEAWGKTGELVADHLGKGEMIVVEGELKLDQWKDKDGGNRSKLFVNVRQMHFVGSKREGQNRREPETRGGAGPPINDRDIPFSPAPIGGWNL